MSLLMKWHRAATLFALLAAGLSLAVAPPSKTSAHKKSTTKKAVGHTTSAHARSRHRRTRRAASGPSYQIHPDPDRYRQIQQALADKGYFKGDVNGVWGPDSVSALQRFQTDCKLPNDGHINSLSLIALGLGPKHDSAAAPPSPGSSAAPVPSPPAPVSSAASDHAAGSHP